MSEDWPTLPLRAGWPMPAEGVDSWIEALARRYRIAPSLLLPALGLPTRGLLVNSLVKDTAPQAWRRMEAAAGLPAEALHDTQLAGASLGKTLVGGGSRFCPRCLGENGGRWLLIWRSNWTIACTRHRLLLHDTCPTCTRTPRIYLPGGTTALPPGTCAHRPRGRAQRCGSDLAAHAATPAHPAVLAVQTWLDDLHQAADHQGDPQAADTLTDLPVVAYWLMAHQQIDWQARATELAYGRVPAPASPANGHLPQMDAALVAAVLDLARIVLGPDHEAGIAALRELPQGRAARTGVMPAGMSIPRWHAMRGPFPNRFLRAVDPGLTANDRLRFKSPVAEAERPTSRDATERGHMIPHLIWPDWAGRLLPVSGFHPDLFRATAATCLLTPGTAERGSHTITSRFNRRVRPSHVSVLLQGFGDLPHPTLEHVLIAFCRIATYLDTNGSPIDYQQRREQIPAHPLITWTQWRDLACANGSHPGDTPRKGESGHGRYLHARRHLLHLLTGADLGAPGHRLSFTSSSDRSAYVAFTTKLTLPLRAALASHAEQILAELDIKEPVTWSPPTTLARGLALPGTDTTALDTDTLRRVVVDEQGTTREAAQTLGVHIEHIRLALEHLDRPERDWKPRALPLTWQRRQNLAQIATREFFEREYLRRRRTLNDLAAETGLSADLLAEAAHAHGITMKKAKAPVVHDPAWLRDQYYKQGKSTSAIAEKLGIAQMTVNNALHRLGLTPRPSGVHSSPQMMNRLNGRLSPDLRAAVDGSLRGWQRLHRFQIAMAFPTLSAAARHLGINPPTLVVQFQRLEDDIGAELFHRSAPGRPQQPTKRGRRLLDYLTKEHIRNHMAQHIPTSELAQLPEHEAAGGRAQFPRPRRPISPFDDIPVARLRITTAIMDLLNDLQTHPDDQCYGALILTRIHRDPCNIYAQLKRLQAAGWITSRLEDDESWLSRAAPGRGPGRRRTYYQPTPAGQTAAHREAARLAAKPPRHRGKRKEDESKRAQHQRDRRRQPSSR